MNTQGAIVWFKQHLHSSNNLYDCIPKEITEILLDAFAETPRAHALRIANLLTRADQERQELRTKNNRLTARIFYLELVFIKKGITMKEVNELIKATKKRGFGGMTVEKRRQIASLGGKKAHALGVAHKYTSEEAREAGSKGGKNRGKG